MATVMHSTNEVTIDAAGVPIGRLASRVATVVRGKDRPDYEPYKLPKITVRISNISKMKISEAKVGSRFHYRYTKYPGGLKKDYWKNLISRPEKLFLLVLQNMLPKNTHQKQLIKNIKFV